MVFYKMFSLIKKVLILVLMTCSSGNIIKSITGNFIKISPPDCFLLKNEECKVRKIILDGDYMTFPYRIKVDKCLGSCNDVGILILKFVCLTLLKILVLKLLTCYQGKMC